MSDQVQNKDDEVIDGIVDTASEQEALDDTENRDTERYPYDGHVVLILVLEAKNELSAPLLLQGDDISRGGIGIVSRHMFHVGAVGAVQMLRSDGKTAVIGVKVKHCRYVGDMKHHSGFEFIPIPERIKESHFTSEGGKKQLIHTMIASRKAA